MADTKLSVAITAALERAVDVDLHHNSIRVTDHGERGSETTGARISLDGEVDNIVTKRRALQIARAAADSADVEDRLLLRVQQDRNGDALLQAVIEVLAGEPAFRDFTIRAQSSEVPPDARDWIAVAVDGNRVQLRGRLWSLSHRRLAEVLTWWTPGTADVDNRIHVQPPEQDTDDEISDAVRLVLEKDPSLDGEQIHIATRNREVFLDGTVTSDVNRRIADYDCWYIPGVHRVHNALQVRPLGPFSGS